MPDKSELTEGVESSDTAAYVASRRMVTQPGQDAALEAASKGEETPEPKKTEPKQPDFNKMLQRLESLESAITKGKDEHTKKLESDLYKTRQKLRKLELQMNDQDDLDDEDDEPKPRGKRRAADDESPGMEEMLADFQKQMKKEFAPLVRTVHGLQMTSQISALASADSEVASAISSLPGEVQGTLLERVGKLTEAMDEEDPSTAMKNAIMYLSYRYGSNPEESGGMVPESGTRAEPTSETEDRKINRALFGEDLVPKKPRFGGS